MVYKSVNARGARSLNIFPCFAVDFLEMKPETMVNSYYQNANHYRNLKYKLPNSGIYFGLPISAEWKIATVREFD